MSGQGGMRAGSRPLFNYPVQIMIFTAGFSSNIYQRDNCIPEKYCYDDATINCNIAGGLYQWDELMDYYDVDTVQGLCPAGWHIPTKAEWDELIAVFQDAAHAGTALKQTGSSGFNGLMEGFFQCL